MRMTREEQRMWAERLGLRSGLLFLPTGYALKPGEFRDVAHDFGVLAATDRWLNARPVLKEIVYGVLLPIVSVLAAAAIVIPLLLHLPR